MRASLVFLSVCATLTALSTTARAAGGDSAQGPYLKWFDPNCIFSYKGIDEIKYFEDEVRPYVCDYLKTRDHDAQKRFASMKLAEQKAYLRKGIADAAPVYQKFEQEKNALLKETDPDDAASRALTPQGQWKRMLQNKRRLINETPTITAAFAANRGAYTEDLLARQRDLTERTATLQEKQEKKEREIKATFETKMSGDDGRSGETTLLKKSAAELRRDSDAAALNRMYGERAGKMTTGERVAAEMGLDPSGKAAPNVRGDFTSYRQDHISDGQVKGLKTVGRPAFESLDHAGQEWEQSAYDHEKLADKHWAEGEKKAREAENHGNSFQARVEQAKVVPAYLYEKGQSAWGSTVSQGAGAEQTAAQAAMGDGQAQKVIAVAVAKEGIPMLLAGPAGKGAAYIAEKTVIAGFRTVGGKLLVAGMAEETLSLAARAHAGMEAAYYEFMPLGLGGKLGQKAMEKAEADGGAYVAGVVGSKLKSKLVVPAYKEAVEYASND